jgi:hypothetical protein
MARPASGRIRTRSWALNRLRSGPSCPDPQAAYAVAARAATELLTSGTYDSVAGGIAYDAMNDAVKPGLR